MTLKIELNIQDEIIEEAFFLAIKGFYKEQKTEACLIKQSDPDNIGLHDANIIITDDITQSSDYADENVVLLCKSAENTDHSHINEYNKFVKPYRVGKIIERINFIVSSTNRLPAETQMIIGPYVMHLRHMTLDEKGKRQIKLTEKERDILAFLGEKPGTITGREELLNKVWGYAEGLDTHTLETHIYRLRQKIESDPANPSILLTDESGYKLIP